MSTKSIVVGVIVIIVIIIGGYFVFKSMGTPQPPDQPQPQDQTASSTAAQPQVQGQDVKVGAGKAAAPGMQVSVLYVGKFTDGTVFDSSAAHGGKPLVFILGAQGLIPGFQIGVNGMKEGGERMLAIPPELGYGAQDVKDQTGKVIIPANSTLVFDIQLVKVEAAPATPAAKKTP